MKKELCKPSKVAIIGAGFVGATAAYALMIEGVANEITLIDVNRQKAEGEALDLKHGLQFVHTAKISFGSDYGLCRDSDVIIVCAGAHQAKGETRLDLIGKNTAIFREIIPKIAKNAPDSILLIVTNPVDILTYAAMKYSGFSKERVIGSGTLLDTARLRYWLSQHFKVSPQHIHAFILGEHGDTEFPVWSAANISGKPLSEFEGYSAKALKSAFRRTKESAYEVISKKGATYYAIGLAIVQIVRAILSDRNDIFPVSTLVNGYYGAGNACLSLPCVINRGGISRQIKLKLNEKERDALHKSWLTLRKHIKNIS
ncbi:TPA: L-lactate dehydrogenase [Candidatus Woesearchaeota archaeon]|nr:L-lactate dehydrogenase [Candidatus Woesearchaeota archaeon]